MNLRKLVETALRLRATNLILAHNHPDGYAMPSREDRESTEIIRRALAGVQLQLLDHIIVVRDGAVSIRESGLIPAILWTAPAPNTAIVKNWLDGETLLDET